MRILVIDDEVSVANLLADAVAAEGHETTIARDGQEALERLSRDRPDAVFLDVSMPGMSGIEVLRKIRATDPDLPVVVITGHADSKEIMEARRLGVSEVIRKPHILNHLTAAFKALDARTKN